MDIEKVNAPYPHLVISNVIRDDVYSKLSFPELEKRENTRAGWDLFKGEPSYDRFFEGDISWKAVRELLDSESFCREILSNFKEELSEVGVDAGSVEFIDFTETPAQQNINSLSGSSFDGKVFTRFDLQASDGSTLRKPHVDHARRIVGGVIFFCDAEEEQLDGGEFGVWSDQQFRDDRVPHDPVLVKSYPVSHNRMYVFLNNNRAFHAPTQLKSAVGSRKWAYFSISAVQDIWKVEKSLFDKVKDVLNPVRSNISYALKNKSFRSK